jgi:type IX secretion system PorP/SprF family membrane protein
MTQKISKFFFFFFILPWLAPAQENQFSHFFNSSQHINPAFAGDVDYMRTGAGTRLMKPLIGSTPVINSIVQFDYKLLDYHSGIGVTLYNHSEQFDHLKFQVNYSYTFQLSRSGWAKGGLGISYNQRNSNGLALKYPDQYSNTGYTGDPTTEPSLHDKSSFPSLTAGIILYNRYVWFSAAGDYLNHPTEDFAGQSTVYPFKFNGALGFLYPLDKNKSSKRRFSRYGGLKPSSSIGPQLSYSQQGKYTEVTGGVYCAVQPIYGGVQIRFQHDFALASNEYSYRAIVFMAGYRQEEFTLAYSYDLSISSNSVNRNGAHELSLAFYFSHEKQDHKRHQLVPLVSQMLY